MAIANKNLTIHDPSAMGKIRWAVNSSGTDSSTAEIIKAAPTTPASLYITKLMINSVAAITILFDDATTTILGPFNFVATAPGVIDVPLPKEGIKWGAAKAFQIKASGAGLWATYVEGFTA